ncbi:hypothetical protein [Actinoplanes sp. NPDC026623]|uniref:hypothetical protein n=1 Tax=Actinoplanes sp. NPDC026623 TaxID=3155610 RepID=UPI0033FA551D
MTDDGFGAMRLHSRAAFENWLAGDLEAREELYGMMGGDPGFDIASLDALEAFLLKRYRKPDAALTLDQRPVLDAAARHVGLVMVLAIDGATWDLDLSDPSGVYFGLPVVQLPDGPAECPLSLVTAALDRRSGDYLSTVVRHLADEWNPAGDS